MTRRRRRTPCKSSSQCCSSAAPLPRPGCRRFRQKNNTDWEPASLYVPDARPDEYVSVLLFTDHIRGAFLDRNPYTRLITYHKLQDLRAANETFEGLINPSDPRPGPAVVHCDSKDENCVPARRFAGDGEVCTAACQNCVPFRFPWVYMGPGIWIDKNVSATNPQRIHIRLSHTHNNINGLDDYTGETDPRRVGLAISSESMTTLTVQGSSHIRFEHLTVRFGGDETVSLPNSTDLVFDHVRFFTSTYGIGMSNIRRTTCIIARSVAGCRRGIFGPTARSITGSSATKGPFRTISESRRFGN